MFEIVFGCVSVVVVATVVVGGTIGVVVVTGVTVVVVVIVVAVGGVVVFVFGLVAVWAAWLSPSADPAQKSSP